MQTNLKRVLDRKLRADGTTVLCWRYNNHREFQAKAQGSFSFSLR